jgi:hypothetical protein
LSFFISVLKVISIIVIIQTESSKICFNTKVYDIFGIDFWAASNINPPSACPSHLVSHNQATSSSTLHSTVDTAFSNKQRKENNLPWH